MSLNVISDKIKDIIHSPGPVLSEEESLNGSKQQTTQSPAKATQDSEVQASKEEKKSLYERLGGATGISEMTNTFLKLRLENPVIKARFSKTSFESMRQQYTDYFIAVSGGETKSPYVHKLKDAHGGMNINAAEFMASTDCLLEALKKHNIEEQEQMEILYKIYTDKDLVMHQ